MLPVVTVATLFACPFACIENDSIRLGVDLHRGGAIGYFALKTDPRNVINTRDLGRWVGASFYAGPKPFGTPHPAWKEWPWNPVAAGDVYGFPGEVLETKFGKGELYLKARPKQWALKNVPAECTVETWVKLVGRNAEIRHRLTNDRKDRTQYPAMDQELPAVYTIGSLHRLKTYTGAKPFTDEAVAEIAKRPAKDGKPQWATFHPTEGWAALVDDQDQGLGLVHPGVGRWLGGFYGKEPKGGPADDPTGYLAPVRADILDSNIVYEYRYALVLDSLEGIRKYAVEHRPKDARPDFRLGVGDRKGWTLANAADDGPPTKSWHLKLEQDDPQLLGPEGFWRAEDVPTLHLRAAFRTKRTTAEVFWQTPEARTWHAERSMPFEIVPDGAMRTYAVELSKVKGYSGIVTRWRIDPVAAGGPGEWAEVEWISGKRE